MFASACGMHMCLSVPVSFGVCQCMFDCAGVCVPVCPTLALYNKVNINDLPPDILRPILTLTPRKKIKIISTKTSNSKMIHLSSGKEATTTSTTTSTMTKQTIRATDKPRHRVALPPPLLKLTCCWYKTDAAALAAPSPPL